MKDVTATVVDPRLTAMAPTVRAPGALPSGSTPVVIYTRSLCIWCLRAKLLLWQRGVAYEERDASTEEVRAALLTRTGKKTVPQIFFGDEAIGGFDDLRALDARGELTSRLSPA